MEQRHDEAEVRKLWQAEAEEQTLETLPAFLKKLSEIEHDYGSIVVAMGAAALGAIRALNRSPQGGITGFQAGCLMFEFIRGLNSEYRDAPLALLNFEWMLYPQYSPKFQKQFPKDVWEWVQNRAKAHLAESPDAHPEVLAHWRAIAAGEVPFGWQVRD